MTKLHTVKATGFRGARYELSLDFKKKHKSMAIFGENAAGKSTITDALEWFIRGRVEHLWKEDCKQDALRNVKCGDDDASRVEISFGGVNQNGTRSLTADLKTSAAFSHLDVEALVKDLKDDRIILRHADIVNFLDLAKGGKREAINHIIGFDKITEFRSVILKSRNTLRQNSACEVAKQQSRTVQEAMKKLVGKVVPDQEVFLQVAKDIVASFDVSTVIVDNTSYAKAVDELRGPGNSAEKIKAAQRLDLLEQTCIDLNSDLGKVIEQLASFSLEYNTLVKERESVNKLRLSDFLTKGEAVINDETFTEDECPFCQSTYDLSKLQTEVGQRVETLTDLQVKLNECKTAKDTLLAAITNSENKAKAIVKNYGDMSDFTALIQSADTRTQCLRKCYQAVKKAFNTLAVFAPPDSFNDAIHELKDNCKISAGIAQKAAKELELTKSEKEVTKAVTTLQTLEGHVLSYTTHQCIITAFEAQIQTLSTLFDAFVKVQNAAIQAILDIINADVGKFYQKLHPEENVDGVHLAVVGEEGVEFEYSFHSMPTQPPRKYLSESHLNSLGIVLFLANARKFNKQARFLVLDDIVTSFDINHRRRLLRLLKEEFADWQLIILTHENVWFDLIKREMDQSGWLFHKVRTDTDNGILLDHSPSTLREIIKQKRETEDVTNDLRKLLEAVMKDISHALEVKVAFRFNDKNEKRMPGELLTHLQSTLNNKSPDSEIHEMFSKLKGSTLIANLDSHDNPEQIVGSDIDVLLEDIDELVKLFVCDKCNKPVRASAPVAGKKAVSCKCGKLQIPWKT